MALNAGEIAIVKGMIQRGDRQSDIAAYFGVNGGRISEINNAMRGAEVQPAPQTELPPPGPYFVSARSTLHAKQTLSALRDLIDQTLQEIEAWEDTSKGEAG
jgi:hypothetical protein